MNEQEFIKQMCKFYKCCNVSDVDIDIILTNNFSKISNYLTATPELMARKFYEWTFNKIL